LGGILDWNKPEVSFVGYLDVADMARGEPVTPYWLMMFLPILAFFVPVKTARDLQIFAMLSFAVLASLYIGTRYDVGGDWNVYILHYNSAANASFIEALTITDPGYCLFNWLAAQFDFGVYGVNLVCAAIFIAGLTVFSRHMPLPWLAIVVAIPYFVTVVAMGYTRQSAALGFELLALSALARGSCIKYFVLVFFAALFHKTAVLLFMFGIFSGPNKFSLLRIIMAIGVAGLTFVAFIMNAYEYFLLQYVTNSMRSAGGLIRVLMNVLPATIYLLFYKQWIRQFGKQEPWLAFALLSLLCIPLVLIVSTAVDRTALYLLPIQLYVWSSVPLLIRNPMFRNAALLSIVGLHVAVLWVWLNYADNVSAWIPYRSILFL